MSNMICLKAITLVLLIRRKNTFDADDIKTRGIVHINTERDGMEGMYWVPNTNNIISEEKYDTRETIITKK